MKQYPLISHRYVSDFFQNKDNIDKVDEINNIDKVNGPVPVYDCSASKCILGQKKIYFGNRIDYITVEGNQFDDTYGLHQPIFYDNAKYYTPQDKGADKQLMEITLGHKDTLDRLTHSYSD